MAYDQEVMSREEFLAALGNPPPMAFYTAMARLGLDPIRPPDDGRRRVYRRAWVELVRRELQRAR